MDKSVQRSLDELLRSLRQSSEYRAFEKAREALDQDVSRRKKTDAFRRENYLLQNSERGALPAEQEKMSAACRKLREDPVINTYLDAELAVCRTLRQVSLRIMDSIDLDLDCMEDILS